MEAVRHEAGSECEMEVGGREGSEEEEEEAETVEEGRAVDTANDSVRLESEQIKAGGDSREPLELLADATGEEAAAYSALYACYYVTTARCTYLRAVQCAVGSCRIDM